MTAPPRRQALEPVAFSRRVGSAKRVAGRVRSGPTRGERRRVGLSAAQAKSGCCRKFSPQTAAKLRARHHAARYALAEGLGGAAACSGRDFVHHLLDIVCPLTLRGSGRVGSDPRKQKASRVRLDSTRVNPPTRQSAGGLRGWLAWLSGSCVPRWQPLCGSHEPVGRASAVKSTPEPVELTPVESTVGSY